MGGMRTRDINWYLQGKLTLETLSNSGEFGRRNTDG